MIRRFPLNDVRAQEFYATVRRLRTERAAAPAIVENALRQTRPAEWSTLVERPEMLSVGVIERLGTIVSGDMTRDPQYALALAELAVSLSEALPPGTYPPITLAVTQATAWKDRGKILSYLSRHDEAIRDFAEAERRLDPFLTAEHDRAVIRLNVAITYSETDRHTEALSVLLECKQTFKEHGDTRLFVLSGFYEGVVLQRLHKYREARETYLLLIASSPAVDSSTLAALHQTIGLCSIELGDFTAAEDNLDKAISIHQKRSQHLDVTKGRHGKGRLLLRRGQLNQGLIALRDVRHQYLKHSLAEEAGLCGLEMVEALLALGRCEDAEHLARTIINEFLAASLNTRAITALGYLTEAIAGRHASPGMATTVHAYVLSLRTNPEREFTLEMPTGAD